MSEHILRFRGHNGVAAVSLPFVLAEVLDGWTKIRSAMLKSVPDAFSRDEWAYLVAFVDQANLRKPFEQSFGAADDSANPPSLLATPRGPVGLWLPNNVSLLGPLMMILVSLTGNRLRMKAGSRSQDLAGEFLNFARQHVPSGALRDYLHGCVLHEVFSQEDPRTAEMARQSAVRIVFGSDEAAVAIHALPHPAESVGITFGDKRSEAWIELGRCEDAVLRDLIKVFAIYGQAGCTSPSRVILLGADETQALTVRDRIVDLWPSVIRARPPMNVASDNVRAWQLARAAGWNSVPVSENRAVVSVGGYGLQTHPNLMEMRIIPAKALEARDRLPENIQTIGHALNDAKDPSWINLLAETKVSRFVPLGTMHHFETVWDGQDFWAQLFNIVRVRL